MLLSNKLTLCSAIFILLAFTVLPVMAHKGTEGNLNHDHPLIEDLPAADFNDDDDTSDTGEELVEAHGPHPVATISLKDADPNSNADGVNSIEKKVVIKADDPATADVAENVFTLVVEFDQDIVAAQNNNITTVVKDFPADSLPTSILADNEFASATLDGRGVLISSGVSVSAVRWFENRKFEADISVVADALPGQKDADNKAISHLKEVMVRIKVNADSVYSIQTVQGFDTIVQGGGNLESAVFDVTLVSALDPDPDPSLNKITPGGLSEGEVKFTFEYDRALLDTQSFRLGDIVIIGGRAVDFDAKADGKTFELTVKADDPTQPITVEAKGKTATSDPAEVSEEVPDLDINVKAPVAPDDDGKLTFTVTSTAPFYTLLQATASNPPLDPTVVLSINDFDINTEEVEPLTADDLVQTPEDGLPDGIAVEYKLSVTPKNAVVSVLVELRAGIGFYDHDGDAATPRVRTPGAEGKYEPETGKPTLAFTISNLDTSGLAENPGDLDSVDGGMVTITASDTVGLVPNTEIVMSEVSVDNGSIMNFAKGNPATFTLIPNVGALQVKVKVSANAVFDGAGNGNKEASSNAFTVGPWFSVPADTILIVSKAAGMTHTYLSDQPRLPINAQPPTPASNIKTDIWHNMPDLEVLFDRSFTNGGTLNLTEAVGQAELTGQTRDGNKNEKNAIRISEVMWASDLSKRGGLNDEEAAEQWIEISNDTGKAVKIFLFARTGRDSAINVDDVEDRIGNAYNGGPGSTSWDVPGQNGNSYTGVDFVSMYRIYVSGDNRGYVNGMSSGHWKRSDREYLTLPTDNPNDGNLYHYKGSPGRQHSFSVPTPDTKKGVTQVPSSPFIINEVANRDNANAAYEWIEIKNVTNTRQNLRRYRISKVTATDTDTLLIDIPNRDYWVDAGDVILLLATDPRHDNDHPITVGHNVDIGAPSDQVNGLGLIVEGSKRKPPRQKVVSFQNGGLPDDGAFVLLLRRPDNAGNNDPAELGKDDIDKIVDIAGHHTGLNKSNYPETTPTNLNNTTLWPLVNYNGDMRPQEIDGNNRTNRLAVNKVRYRQHRLTVALPGKNGKSNNRGGTGFIHKDRGKEHYAFRDAEYTGLGYKRTARITRDVGSVHNGTPGYDGNSVGPTNIIKDTAANAKVTISEIMASTGPDVDNPVLPQWIELYNSSPTDAVSLKNWKLRFEMLDADGNPMDSLIDLDLNKGRVKVIQPQQTILIVAGNARQANSDAAAGTDVFNDNRVFNVFRDYGGANKFGANNRYQFFNPKAFYLAVIDKNGAVVDVVGNLDGDGRTSDTNIWDFPEGVATDGNRTSFIRVYDDGEARTALNIAESNVMPVFGTGDKKMKGNDGIHAKWAWIPAVNTEREFKVTIRSTWYGIEDDYGTPNNRPGMVLPVELSHFRPTLEDGVVTIRWTTESELDNAGFNILRSETRNGEYKQVNAEMIQGAGTTGERSSYKWVDQTAKPGVVYYYQIEDVSFAGERQALAITKLKGLISAENKLTTTWSEIKTSQ